MQGGRTSGLLDPCCESREDSSSLKRNLGKCVGGWEGTERKASVFQALESNSALWTLMGWTAKWGFHRGNEGLRKKK